MSDEVFTDTDEAHEEWVDVRMTNPDEGEWDVDLVVVDGQVEYVDLRVRPSLLEEFVDCLVADVGDERAAAMLSAVAERNGVDLSGEQSGA